MMNSTWLLRLRKNPGFRMYAANTTWMVGEKVLRLFMGLLVGIWVARYLGPEQFGLLSYVQSLVFLFTVFAALGLDAVVVRELVKDSFNAGKFLGTAFGLKLIGAILIFPLLVLALMLSDSDDYTRFLVFVVASSVIFYSFNVVDYYFQSKVMSRYVALANTISLGASSVLKVLLIVNEASLDAFAFAALFDAVVLAAGLIFFYVKKSSIGVLSWRFELSVAKMLLADSWPLVLSSVTVAIYMKMDQLMIKEMLSVDSVGHYAAAVRLSEAWYFIPTVVANSLFPAIVNSRKSDLAVYHKRMQRLYCFMIWVALLISIPVSMLSPWLVVLLYGADYQLAAEPLKYHIWASVFVFLAVASGKYLTAENMTRKVFYRNISGAICNGILNVILIPRYGISGAAIATLISWAVSGYLYDFFDRDVRVMFLSKTQALFFMGLKSDLNNKNGISK